MMIVRGNLLDRIDHVFVTQHDEVLDDCASDLASRNSTRAPLAQQQASELSREILRIVRVALGDLADKRDELFEQVLILVIGGRRALAEGVNAQERGVMVVLGQELFPVSFGVSLLG